MTPEQWHYVDSPVKGRNVHIGKNADIDTGVILGYPSGKGHLVDLLIGPDARIRSGTVIYAGSRIGSGLETGHYVTIREDNHIGDRLKIWSHSVIEAGCRIGSGVKIHTKVFISQHSIIQDDVFLASGVTLANEQHPGCPEKYSCAQGPCINKGAQIGVNSTILPGVTIGEYAIIGAGSVVTKDIPTRVVVYGNPAQVICDISEVRCSRGLREGPYTHIIDRV